MSVSQYTLPAPESRTFAAEEKRAINKRARQLGWDLRHKHGEDHEVSMLLYTSFVLDSIDLRWQALQWWDATSDVKKVNMARRAERYRDGDAKRKAVLVKEAMEREAHGLDHSYIHLRQRRGARPAYLSVVK